MRLKIEEVVSGEHQAQTDKNQSHEATEKYRQKAQMLEEKLIEVKTLFAESMHKYESDRNRSVKEMQRYQNRINQLAMLLKRNNINFPLSKEETPLKPGSILRRS